VTVKTKISRFPPESKIISDQLPNDKENLLSPYGMGTGRPAFFSL
jgi:hypothetical protein